MTETQTPELPAPRPRRRGRTIFAVTLVALVAAFAGAFGSAAFSQGFGFGPRAWHRGPGFLGGDPARIEERADRMVRHLAVELDATSEQQEQLRGIVKAALKDLLPMREKAQALRQRGRELLLAPTVDRAAIESLRGEHMTLADTFSKRVSQALADAASVLNADQRRKLAEMWPPRGRRGPGGRWHRG